MVSKDVEVHARLKANTSQPAIPTVLLASVCSLDNELGYIRLQQTAQREIKDAFCFNKDMAQWHCSRDGNPEWQHANILLKQQCHTDRKNSQWGLICYINTDWCVNTMLVSSYCSPPSGVSDC